MTDLQVKWQSLQEQKRANQVLEDLKARDVATNEFKAQLEEQQVPARVAQMLGSANLSEAQRDKVISEIDKVHAEIERLKADTALTDLERRSKAYELLNSASGRLIQIFGTDSLTNNNLIDIIKSVFGGFLNSAGKAIGATLFA